MIAALSKLVYLDDKPVTPYERLCAEAFIKGGREGEKEARDKFNEEKKQKDLEWANQNKEREEKFKKRRQAELERFAREALDERERLLKQKSDLTQTKPEGYESKIRSIEARLVKLDETINEMQEQIDRQMSNTTGASKFSAVLRTQKENGEYEYLNVSKEEYEAHMQNQKKPELRSVASNAKVHWTPELNELLTSVLHELDGDFEGASAELTRSLYGKGLIKVNEILTADQIKSHWTALEQKIDDSTTETSETQSTVATANGLDELE